jgi:hypothetical protein
MHLPAFITFASDATVLGLWGAGCMVVALLAAVGDWRRGRRRQIDAVGFMPWTTVFVLSASLGVALLLVAAKGWLAG